MGNRVDPKNLVGANEIAKRLNRRHSTVVHAWHRKIKAFPSPVAVLTMGKIWDWTEVAAWARKTKRLK
jgi:hypothetical protein